MKKHYLTVVVVLLFAVAILLTYMGVSDIYVWLLIVIAQLLSVVVATQYFEKL